MVDHTVAVADAGATRVFAPFHCSPVQLFTELMCYGRRLLYFDREKFPTSITFSLSVSHALTGYSCVTSTYTRRAISSRNENGLFLVYYSFDTRVYQETKDTTFCVFRWRGWTVIQYL